MLARARARRRSDRDGRQAQVDGGAPRRRSEARRRRRRPRPRSRRRCRPTPPAQKKGARRRRRAGADAAAAGADAGSASAPRWAASSSRSTPTSAPSSTSPAGWYQDDRHDQGGDDPQATGFNAQEVELALQAVVDPYFRADIFLTIPNLAGHRGRRGVPHDDAPAGQLPDQGGRLPRRHRAAERAAPAPAGLHAPPAAQPAVPRHRRAARARAAGQLAGAAHALLPGARRLGRSRWRRPSPISRCRRSAAASAWDFTYLATARAFFPLQRHDLAATPG